MFERPYRLFFLAILVLPALLSANFALASAADPGKRFFYGTVTSKGMPVKGAMVTFYHGSPVHSLTVFTDDQGRYLTPHLPWKDGYTARVRRAGWQDKAIDNLGPAINGTRVSAELERVTDPAEMIQQLPSNYWMSLVLDQMKEHPEQLLEFKTQCTGCHQQGSPLTSRRQFTREQWIAIIHDMGTRSAILTDTLRNALPDYLVKAYDQDNVLAKLPKYDSAANNGNGPLPVPSTEARKAVIEEWELGGRTSSHHDMMVYHPDGSIWSVDGPTDTLYKVSFANNPDGDRKAYAIPRGDHKPGGIYYKMRSDKDDDYLGAHSLQTAPNGDIWLTLASGNQLAGFNPKTEKWDMVDLKEGLNPHTLRFDKKGRIWYTISATNQVGMYDPATREQKFVNLPAPDLKTRLILWATPFLIAHADWFNLKENSANSNGVSMPVPYGIDINPADGSVWYSQLYMRHIGRIDPETLKVTSIATPFDTPRRLRFDSKGGLWVPSYSEGSINLFDTQKMQWVKSWSIPVEPAGSEVPYAVYVDKKTDNVWITGTQSDSMIRFNPATEQWTQYPLPTRVTYTREIDMDDQGGMWSSHASYPTWHIEGALPKLVRVDPTGAPDIDTSGVFREPEIHAVKTTRVYLHTPTPKKK